MDEKKNPLFATAMRELNEAVFALHTVINEVEAGKVEEAVRAYPTRELRMRVGEIIAKMRMTSATVHELCTTVADHTDLPAVKKLIGRP